MQIEKVFNRKKFFICAINYSMTINFAFQNLLDSIYDSYERDEAEMIARIVFEDVFDDVVLSEYRNRIDKVYDKQTQEFNEADLIKINDITQ